MNFLAKLGRVIAAHRKQSGLTQEDLAGLTEMDRAFISLVENGRTSPSVTTLVRIAEAMNTSASKLLQSAGK